MSGLQTFKKDWEKGLVSWESPDSHFFLRARGIKRETVLETLSQKADDEFWKQNKKNIHDRKIASGGYNLCFEMYPKDFFSATIQ